MLQDANVTYRVLQDANVTNRVLQDANITYRVLQDANVTYRVLQHTSSFLKAYNLQKGCKCTLQGGECENTVHTLYGVHCTPYKVLEVDVRCTYY